MTNLEKIRKMSAEELGAFLGKAINQCSLCHYQDIPECSGKCEKGITKWLNQQQNPMPEIKEGDIIFYVQNHFKYYAFCVYGNIVYAPSKGECSNFGGEIKQNTVAIKRYSIAKGTIEDIWRADNG